MTTESSSTGGYLHTGQSRCHDADGGEIPCKGSGQDAEFGRGHPWPEPRFVVDGERVDDRLTGLVWSLDANLAEFPLGWQEALDFIAEMNAEARLGHTDWRLPNRRELRSLISHDTRRPALPADHPFHNLFTHWYWTSTSSAGYPNHAWYVNMDGGRMFYGGKDQAFMVWPVRGEGNGVVPRTGQTDCFNTEGEQVCCEDSGQDGAYRCGRPWPEPRFEVRDAGIIDHLSGLLWHSSASLEEKPVSWQQALDSLAELNREDSNRNWRLPSINELESLIDASRFDPALPAQHPFKDVQPVYWSATTSLYEPDWAWALYMDKGAVGVGQKSFARFHVWAVSDGPESAG